MAIIVKFIGSLRNFFEEGNETFDYETDITIKELINLIINTKPNIRELLISPQNDEFRLNSLILVNGVEISVLNGLETKLFDEDEITLIPVIHGG
jgi:molybdopterin converting factor small subunit